MCIEKANSIVKYCLEKKYKVTNFTLQKLLFELQVQPLKRNDSLFEKKFKKWKFSPTLEPVYFNYCYNGGLPINEVNGKLEEVPKWVFEEVDNFFKIYNKEPWYFSLKNDFSDGDFHDDITNEEIRKRLK